LLNKRASFAPQAFDFSVASFHASLVKFSLRIAKELQVVPPYLLAVKIQVISLLTFSMNRPIDRKRDSKRDRHADVPHAFLGRTPRFLCVQTSPLSGTSA
jgi:hypothetical protein